MSLTCNHVVSARWKCRCSVCFHFNFCGIGSTLTCCFLDSFCRQWSCNCTLITTFSGSYDEYEEVYRTSNFLRIQLDNSLVDFEVVEAIDSEVSFAFTCLNSNFDEKLVAAFCTQLGANKGERRWASDVPVIWLALTHHALISSCYITSQEALYRGCET